MNIDTVIIVELTLKTLMWWIFLGSDNSSKGPAVKKYTINQQQCNNEGLEKVAMMSLQLKTIDNYFPCGILSMQKLNIEEIGWKKY